MPGPSLPRSQALANRQAQLHKDSPARAPQRGRCSACTASSSAAPEAASMSGGSSARGASTSGSEPRGRRSHLDVALGVAENLLGMTPASR